MEYKILLIKNRFRDRIDFSYGIKHMQEKTPLKLVIDEIITDIDLKFIQIGNGVYTGGVPSNTQDFKQFVKEGKYNAVVLVYGNDCPYMRVSTVENIPLYKDTEFITLHNTYDSGETLNHELFHAFFKKLARYGIYLNDPMDTYENDKNLYAPVSNRTKAIALLNPYWKNVCSFNKQTNKPEPMQKDDIKNGKNVWRYFKLTEKTGVFGTIADLKPELVTKLDEARHIAGIPFKLTSGYRSPEHNAKVGGVKDSAHLTREAVDIACTNDTDRWKIINSLISVGFNRIGISKTFIHADIAKDKTQKVIWLY